MSGRMCRSARSSALRKICGPDGFSDFLRPALYNNVAGGRFASFVKGRAAPFSATCHPNATVGKCCFRQLNYNEAPFDKLAAIGFSADYVERETRRAVEAVAGHPVQIWPGVDIDVPVGEGESHCTPEGVASAVKAAFKGGATRHYLVAQLHRNEAGEFIRRRRRAARTGVI